MSPWGMVIIALAGIAGSAAVNLIIVSMAVGRYKVLVEECVNEIGLLRTSLTGAREDIARIKGQINFKMWKGN